jgi:hypothetical protein
MFIVPPDCSKMLSAWCFSRQRPSGQAHTPSRLPDEITSPSFFPPVSLEEHRPPICFLIDILERPLT